MKVSTLKPKTMFGSRLAFLRREHGLSQSAFAKEFSEFTGRKKQLTLASVSLWEQGERMPDATSLIAIAKFFNVTLDFLTGLSAINSFDNEASESNQPLELKDFIFKIDITSLRKYDGLPIYVVFLNMDYQNQWGILNSDTYSIVFKNMSLKISEITAEFYTYPRPCDVHASVFNAYSFNLSRLMNAEEFWVELKNSSSELRYQYAGWWRHNENKTGIINPANGLTLPYEGLCVSYNAFSEPI